MPTSISFHSYFMDTLCVEMINFISTMDFLCVLSNFILNQLAPMYRSEVDDHVKYLVFLWLRSKILFLRARFWPDPDPMQPKVVFLKRQSGENPFDKFKRMEVFGKQTGVTQPKYRRWWWWWWIRYDAASCIKLWCNLNCTKKIIWKFINQT